MLRKIEDYAAYVGYKYALSVHCYHLPKTIGVIRYEMHLSYKRDISTIYRGKMWFIFASPAKTNVSNIISWHESFNFCNKKCFISSRKKIKLKRKYCND